jgi:two-component system LytT family response regulator
VTLFGDDLSGNGLPDGVNRLRRHGKPVLCVVSATAFDEHALATSEPKMADRSLDIPLGQCVGESLGATFRRAAAGQTAGRIEALPQQQMVTTRLCARIAIKTKGRILLIDPAHVIAVEAKGNYVLLQHLSSFHPLRESMSTMEEKLTPHGFVRIHRSVLVNAAFVAEIQPWSTGEYVLRVRGGREYTVTRTYKRNLQFLADAWIGTEHLFTE